jgi:hypothetical protein
VQVSGVSEAVSWLPPRPVWGVFHHTAPFQSCAVVGSSPSLTRGEKARGEEIDAHDLVMRFNNAPTKVRRGSRRVVYSDAQVANPNVKIFARGDRNTVPERWANPKHSRRTCTCEYGLQSSAGVAKRPRELNPTRNPYDPHLLLYASVVWAVFSQPPVCSGLRPHSSNTIFLHSNSYAGWRSQGYETYVGSKTSLRWENARFSGFRENRTETLLGWCEASHHIAMTLVVKGIQRCKSCES